MQKAAAVPRTQREYERAADAYCRSLPLEHFMEATPQGTQRKITLESLDLLQTERPDVKVFNELLVQYPLNGHLGQVVPDNMIVLGADEEQARGSFNLPFEPVHPFLVMEYVSPRSERKDYKESFRKYEAELRVLYCILFHPEKQDLRVHRHRGRHYKQLKPNAAGRYAIPELELELGLKDGWVRFWYQGKLLELPQELKQELLAEKQRADQEERRAERERRRAERERQRADQERQRADAARAEIERLRALLESSGKSKKNGGKRSS